MDAPWRALTLDVPASISEEISGRLAPLSRGTEFQGGPADQVRLFVFLRDSADEARALAAADQILGQYGLDAKRADLRVIEIDDGRWVERYQAALRPFPLGRAFLVDPTGRGVPAGERIPIRLVPGRAFGTGEHATTQLCAEQLEHHVVRGSRWIDLGCGTGLLCIVAAGCGAGEILALDVDPEAVRVAQSVLRDNRPSARIVLALGSLETAATGLWDGIVANISGTFLLGAAASVAGRLKVGGWLIASGFLVDDLPALLDAFSRAGLSEHRRLERANWAALVLQRRMLAE